MAIKSAAPRSRTAQPEGRNLSVGASLTQVIERGQHFRRPLSLFRSDTSHSSRVQPISLVPPGSYYIVKPYRVNQHGFNSPVAFYKTNSSWTSFVDNVKRCFRGSAETAEAGRSDYLANAFFA